jgi:putative ABC transport system permease protein
LRTLLLAVRNLLRNRRRSLATLLALAIGSTSILLFGGYSTNIKYTMQTANVRMGGHLQIQHRDFYQYGSGNPTAYGIDDYQKIIDAIAKDSLLSRAVVVATPTLQFGGIAGNYEAGVSRTIFGIGLVAADHNLMRRWNGLDISLASQPLALERAAADAAIIGTGLGRVLRLCESLHIADCPAPQAQSKGQGQALSDDIAQLSLQDAPPNATPTGPQRRIELLASSARGTPNVASLQVIQAERQGLKELDDVFVMLQLPQAQRLIYGAATPRATAIMIQLHQAADLAAVRSRLTTLLATTAPGRDLTTLDFRDLNPFYVQATQLFDTIFGFISALIGGIVLFTVGNTMNMAVVERTIEIGTLRAIGLRRSGVRWLFVIEGFLLGLCGAVAGLLVALAAAAIINHTGLTWLPPGSSVEVPLTLTIWGEHRMIIGTTLGLIAVATLSALWPAHRAARMVVVDALRHT